jgi:uncharacterized protein YjiS (DUF1127 family)
MFLKERRPKVATSSTFIPQFGSSAGKNTFVAVSAAGQHILNSVVALARRIEERRTLAELPRRYLDDAGIVVSDFNAGLPGMDPSFPSNAQSLLARRV